MLASVLFGAAALSAERVRYELEPGESLLAVVVRRAGPAARLAHDHLVSAPLDRAELELDPRNPEATVRFSLRVPVSELRVDRAEERAWVSPRAIRLGVLPEPGLPPLNPKDAAKVREAMLGASQLDAGRYPEVGVELLGLERRGGGSEVVRVGLPWNARIRFKVRGTVRELQIPLRYELGQEDQLTVEAVGHSRFQEFGMEPYSTLLGAIRNADDFHLVVLVAARPTRDQ